jgi:hypothetical protein
LVPLATTGAKRAPLFPNVPTIAESGYPGFDSTNWYAFVASSKTPAVLLDRWNLEIVKVLNDKEVIASLTEHGLTPNPTSRDELAKYMAKESSAWAKVIKDKLTSKNYYRHTIHLVTNHYTTSEKTIQPILDYLNRNEYFETLQKAGNNNILVKMNKNEEVIGQINNLLAEFSTTSGSNQKSDKLVYYNERPQLVFRNRKIIKNGNRYSLKIDY